MQLKRSATDASTIRGPYNSNRHSSYVELVLVVDNTNFKFHKTVKNVHNYCKTLVNLVNALYVPLNVFVALTGVEVWSEKDEFEITTEAEVTLLAFAAYRREKLLPKQNNDNAQLLTKKQFAEQVVGKFDKILGNNRLEFLSMQREQIKIKAFA